MFKFANGYKYFCKDSLTFKITLFEPTATESDFTPHIDRPEINYRNLFIECKYIESNKSGGNILNLVEAKFYD